VDLQDLGSELLAVVRETLSPRHDSTSLVKP
jgi:hypothetical protein